MRERTRVRNIQTVRQTDRQRKGAIERKKGKERLSKRMRE